jgi:hypothetical protein
LERIFKALRLRVLPPAFLWAGPREMPSWVRLEVDPEATLAVFRRLATEPHREMHTRAAMRAFRLYQASAA